MLAQSPTTTVFRLVKTKMTALSVLCDLCDGSGGVMRRPSAQTRVREITCPLNSCIIDGCEGTLIDKDRMIPAVLYTMSGPVEIAHRPKQCTSRNCRATYAYNFRWENSKKVNVLSLEDLEEDMLFVSSTKAFSLQYLRYHEELLFRGHVSTRAIEHAYNVVFNQQDT